MRERIHLSKADVTEVEERYVLGALRSGWVAPLGPDVDAFERETAERVGVKYALALSSGTAALHLALLHLGARPGTVVVLPSLTFAASANAVAYTGAQPVFVDSQSSDGNVDPQLLIQAVDTLLDERQQVAAVMTVDLFGRACDYDIIEPALANRGVPLLEDAAEALGTISRAKSAGSFGVAAALSFNGNKIMTTSGGGMLLSDDFDLIDHCRSLSTQARQPVAWYEHTEVGYNYRLSNILAALGRAQLSRLDEFLARRRAIRAEYIERLSTIPGLNFLPNTSGMDAERFDNCWLTTVTLESDTLGRDDALHRLARNNIEARHLWKPLHLQPVFAGARTFGGSVSEHLFNTGVALPSGSGLRTEDISRVCTSLLDAT